MHPPLPNNISRWAKYNPYYNNQFRFRQRFNARFWPDSTYFFGKKFAFCAYSIMMKPLKFIMGFALISAIILAAFFGTKASFPHPYERPVQESGLDPHLVYSVIKAESSFREDAVSRSGAIGLMQLRPSTAEFICERTGIEYDRNKLTDAEYNIRLGCLYLRYLFEKFPVQDTALAAYNAGEGTVRGWLEDKKYSDDGATLKKIPYSETCDYVKKVKRARKCYEFFY